MYGVRSSIGALLLLTEGVTPFLLNHSRRVGFPTTLCTLSRGRSLSLCRERWCQQINGSGIFLFQCIFLGQCTLKLITLSLRRLRSPGQLWQESHTNRRQEIEKNAKLGRTFKQRKSPNTRVPNNIGFPRDGYSQLLSAAWARFYECHLSLESCHTTAYTILCLPFYLVLKAWVADAVSFLTNHQQRKRKINRQETQQPGKR